MIKKSKTRQGRGYSAVLRSQGAGADIRFVFTSRKHMYNSPN